MGKDFNADEYFLNLPVMTYKKIIDLLKDQSTAKHIFYSTYVAVTGTGTIYQYIVVRNLKSGKEEIYLSPDQDIDDIDKNLHHILDNWDLDPDYAYKEDYIASYFATVGVNLVNFPIQIATRIVREWKELAAKRKKDLVRAKINLPDYTEEDCTTDLPFDI